jgi:hypothetical protein
MAMLQNCSIAVKFDLSAHTRPTFWLLQSQNHQILQQYETNLHRKGDCHA